MPSFHISGLFDRKQVRIPILPWHGVLKNISIGYHFLLKKTRENPGSLQFSKFRGHSLRDDLLDGLDCTQRVGVRVLPPGLGQNVVKGRLDPERDVPGRLPVVEV